MPDQTITIALISGVASGLGVAVVNYILNRKKTIAETEKIIVETAKIRSELRDLSDNVNNIGSIEQIIFGNQEINGFDIKGSGGKFWTGLGKEAKAISDKGEGSLIFEDGGILNIQRTNTEGRFEIVLIKYLYNGKEYTFIPKNELITGKRMIKLTFEAKVLGGDHYLRGVIRNPITGKRMDENIQKITGNQWTKVQMFLKGDPNEECQIRIDDEQVAIAPSSLQIRNIMVTERKA